MSVCLALGATLLTLAAPEFILSWTHSVERTEWRETWRVASDGLHLLRSEVRGSGAGMDPGPDARLAGGWWVSEPDLRVPALSLAASGATGGGWRLCTDGTCRTLGDHPGMPVVIAPCAIASPAISPSGSD